MAIVEDPASVLEHFVHDVANLPAEITHLYEEMQAKDALIQECRSIINARDSSIQKFIKLNSSMVKNPKEDGYAKIILQNYERAQLLQEEKIALSEKAAALLDRHIKRLDIKIRDLQNDGSIPTDPSLPSLLRTDSLAVPPASSLTTGTNTPLHPLSGNTSGGAANIAHAAIARIASAARIAGASASSIGVSGTPGSGSGVGGSGIGSPAAHAAHHAPSPHAHAQAVAAMNRAQREVSVGSDTTKRRRLNATLGTLPAAPSNLARQSSLGPGTPKPSTPGGAGSRAGSVGPRAPAGAAGAAGAAGLKKMMRKAPHQQIGLRKKVGQRAGLHHHHKKARPRGAGRGSPSTTADDESVVSADGTEEEGGSPREVDGDGDVEMEEMEDDTKYCFCQSVSRGNMVACDNENCKYQWFHYECVGIKEEPEGEWFCSECLESMKKREKKKGR